MQQGFLKAWLWVLAAGLAACTGPATRELPGDAAKPPAILKVLPNEIARFTYRGLRRYPDPGGYSLRYTYNDSRLPVYSDVYVYPVPETLKQHTQPEILGAMTQHALQEIAYVQSQGIYSAHRVLRHSTFVHKGQHVLKTELTLVKENLESYSLIYMTEKNGKLLKVRMTMPDNKVNRQSAVWEKFVTEIYSTLIDNIDKS